MEDVRKWDYNVLLLREGRNISQISKSYFNTEKSKQPCLAFNTLQSVPLLIRPRSSGGGGQGWRGRLAALASRRNASTARAVPPSGTAAQLRSSPAALPGTKHRPTGLLWTKRGGSRPPPAGTEWGLEPPGSGAAARSAAPAGPAPRRPGRGPPAPGHGAAAPGSSSAPVLPRRAQRRRSSPRTHSPASPTLLSAPLAAAAVAKWALPLPGRPGPAGTWSSGRGRALPAEPRCGRCRRNCAGLPRCCSAPGGRLRRHHEEESRGAGERTEGTFRLLPAPRSPEESVCPWPAQLVGLCGAEPAGAPLAPVLEPRARGLRGRRGARCEKEEAPAPSSAPRSRSRGWAPRVPCAAPRPPGLRRGCPGRGLRLTRGCPTPLSWMRAASYSGNRS